MTKLFYRYDHEDAFKYHENSFDALRAMGISWERFEAHPIAGMVAFYGCRNVPDKLPECIDRFEE